MIRVSFPFFIDLSFVTMTKLPEGKKTLINERDLNSINHVQGIVSAKPTQCWLFVFCFFFLFFFQVKRNTLLVSSFILTIIFKQFISIHLVVKGVILAGNKVWLLRNERIILQFRRTDIQFNAAFIVKRWELKTCKFTSDCDVISGERSRFKTSKLTI